MLNIELPRFHANQMNTHEYTNDGQVIGAGSVSGSNTNYQSIDWISGTTLSSIFGQRISFNEDCFIAEIQDKAKHNVEHTLGLKRSQRVNDFMISAQFLSSYRFNRYYAIRKRYCQHRIELIR